MRSRRTYKKKPEGRFFLVTIGLMLVTAAIYFTLPFTLPYEYQEAVSRLPLLNKVRTITGEARIDASTEESLKHSMKAVMAGRPEEEQKKIMGAILILSLRNGFKDGLLNPGPQTPMEQFGFLNGMSGDDLLAKGTEIAAEMEEATQQFKVDMEKSRQERLEFEAEIAEADREYEKARVESMRELRETMQESMNRFYSE